MRVQFIQRIQKYRRSRWPLALPSGKLRGQCLDIRAALLKCDNTKQPLGQATIGSGNVQCTALKAAHWCDTNCAFTTFIRNEANVMDQWEKNFRVVDAVNSQRESVRVRVTTANG